MASGADISGLIASWVGVGIAIFGIIGIIAPLILLLETRSHTHIALQSVDDSSNEFIGSGVSWWNGDRLFRRVKVPKLSEMPDFKVSRVNSLSQTVSSGLKEPEESREVVGGMKTSTTGWVNLANFLSKIHGMPKRGNFLLIQKQESWLPVHRLWLLAFGLKGRFGIRDDLGKAYLGKPETDYEYREENTGFQSRKILSGTTGLLELDLTYTENAFQKVYFGMHNKEFRGDLEADPSEDKISLSTLFWLSFGFLPGKPGQPIYHLGSYSRFGPNSIEPQQTYNECDQEHAINAHQPHLYEFKPTNLAGGQIRWGQALDVNLETQIWRLELVDSQKEPNTGPWTFPEGTSDTDWFALGGSKTREHYIQKNDVYCIVLTLMELELSPLGFLSPQNSWPLAKLLFNSGSEILLPLLNCARECKIEIFQGKEENIDRIINTIRDTIEPQGPSYSHSLIASLYELHKIIEAGLGHPSRFRNTVAILTITDKVFGKKILEKGENGDEMNADMLHLIRAVTNTRSGEKSASFNGFAGEGNDQFPTNTTLCDILLPALEAATRCLWFNHALDSTELIQFVDCMGDVVQVGSSSRGPYAPPIWVAIDDGSGARYANVAKIERRILKPDTLNTTRPVPLDDGTIDEMIPIDDGNENLNESIDKFGLVGPVLVKRAVPPALKGDAHELVPASADGESVVAEIEKTSKKVLVKTEPVDEVSISKNDQETDSLI